MHRLLLAATLAAGACAHERLVIADREGPAPATIDRPTDLRALLRTRARELRRRVKSASFTLISGFPDIQRPAAPGPHPALAGPVQARGDHLVLLREDQLLVVAAQNGLQVVADVSLDPSFRPALLLHGDQVIVVLPRPRRNLRRPVDLELRRFTLGADGRITRGASTHLRTGFGFDATRDIRVVGDDLALHLETLLGSRTPDLLGLPEIWRAGRWQRLVRPRDLQRPLAPTTGLHTRVRCSLARPDDCTARGLLAPTVADVQADDHAFYLWTRGALWRQPIADAPATAVRIDTSYPLGPLAWRVADDGDVDAVVRTPADRLAHVHVPAATLHAGLRTLPAPTPLDLPATEVAARFVGDLLLLGDHPTHTCDGPATLRVRALADGATTTLALPHCVTRIEPAGDRHALAFAAPVDPWDAPVQLSAVDLSAAPTLGDTLRPAHARADSTRADGPHDLGPARALTPQSDAPLPLFTHDATRLTDLGGVPGQGRLELTFHHDGRIFILRADELHELAVRDGKLELAASLALPCPPPHTRPRSTLTPRCR